MSGKPLLDQIDDLSEDDHDFVPEPKPKRTSAKRRRSADDSASSDSDTSDSETDGENAAKRLKGGVCDAEDEVQERKRKEAQVAADWKSIIEVEEEARKERQLGLTERAGGEDTVEVTRPRFFAGETIYETVRLPRTHTDVKKYGPTTGTSTRTEESVTDAGTANTSTATQSEPSNTASTPATIPSKITQPTPASAPAEAKHTKAPIRRRPRQSLESMNAALVAASKGKKMTTIEKSAHDWSAHTSRDAGLAEQLAANRRENGGGYLEKKAFLDRVGERRDDLLENGKSRRRR